MAKVRSNPPSITWPRGFRAAGGTCGIKPSGLPDLALIVADDTCSAAGVFTRNRMPGAPVVIGKRHIRSGRARAIVCNSGVSNVCTGQQGIDDAITMCRTTAETIGDVEPGLVLPCSTGVIGHRLPIDKITRGIEQLFKALSTGKPADADAARAIMTTDTVPKHARRSVKIDGKTIRLGAIAKGAGMIAPDMATMLCFITTDAAIKPRALKQALRDATDAPASFNRLSIDHDTSTSDSVLILAGGKAGNATINDASGQAYETFRAALIELCCDLAYQIISDGEGVTRVFRVKVSGAASQADADKVGRTIVGSPLVKSAVHGGDPNWGRLVMGIGRSGAKVNPAKVCIALGAGRSRIVLCDAGTPTQRTKKQQAAADAAMRRDEVIFHIDLGNGDGCAEWLGCDLSHEYVTINADYTT